MSATHETKSNTGSTARMPPISGLLYPRMEK
jgi:hypothetical protein